jgi:hypothetical protein
VSTPRWEAGRRALLPDPRRVGHCGNIPQTQPCHAIQQARLVPTRRVGHHPTAPQHLALDHHWEPLLGQLGRGFARARGGPATRPAPFGIRLIRAPFRGHRHATVQPGGALGTDIAGQHPGLAVGPRAQCPAALTRHAHRMAAWLRHIPPIDHEHAIVGPQVRCHCLPVPVQPPLIAFFPRALRCRSRLHQRTCAFPLVAWIGVGSFSRRRSRCRLTLVGSREAQAPSTSARQAGVFPVFVRPPWRQRSPREDADGVRPRDFMRCLG